MWELDCEESWAPKNWCFWTVVLQKTLESPLDCKEIPLVHPKGDQSGVFIRRTDVEPETPLLWPPDAKSWLIGKDSDAGRDWAQEEKGMTEYEMAGWPHWLDGRESEWTPGVGDGQGGLACCGSWSCKELDTTERLNWTTQGRTVLDCQTCLQFTEKRVPSYPFPGLPVSDVLHFSGAFVIIKKPTWNIYVNQTQTWLRFHCPFPGRGSHPGHHCALVFMSLERRLWAVMVSPTSPVFDDLDISEQWPGVLQDVL